MIQTETEAWLETLICAGCGHSANKHSEGDGCSCCSSDEPSCYVELRTDGSWEERYCPCTEAKSTVIFKALHAPK